jgi:hypothetical protein
LNHPNICTCSISAGRKIATSSALHTAAFRIAFIQGDRAAMEREIAWGRNNDSVGMFGQQSAAAGTLGQLHKADEFTQKAIDAALRQNLQGVAANSKVGRVRRDAYFGNCDPLRRISGEKELAEASNLTAYAAALAACGETAIYRPILKDVLCAAEYSA